MIVKLCDVCGERIEGIHFLRPSIMDQLKPFPVEHLCSDCKHEAVNIILTYEALKEKALTSWLESFKIKEENNEHESL